MVRGLSGFRYGGRAEQEERSGTLYRKAIFLYQNRKFRHRESSSLYRIVEFLYRKGMFLNQKGKVLFRIESFLNQKREFLSRKRLFRRRKRGIQCPSVNNSGGSSAGNPRKDGLLIRRNNGGVPRFRLNGMAKVSTNGHARQESC